MMRWSCFILKSGGKERNRLQLCTCKSWALFCTESSRVPLFVWTNYRKVAPPERWPLTHVVNAVGERSPAFSSSFLNLHLVPWKDNDFSRCTVPRYHLWFAFCILVGRNHCSGVFVDFLGTYEGDLAVLWPDHVSTFQQAKKCMLVIHDVIFFSLSWSFKMQDS